MHEIEIRPPCPPSCGAPSASPIVSGLRTPRRRAAAWLGLFLAACVASGEPASLYAPYRFLVGEWDLAPESGGPAFGIARFRFGPNQSYLWYSSSFVNGGAETPHFEGMLVWNGVKKNLDMLMTMDLQHGLVQEQGTVSAGSDGRVTRDITAVYSEGARPISGPPAGPQGVTLRFRQTFKAAGPDRIVTSALRDSGHGWVATFPGSDHLAMTRRAHS